MSETTQPGAIASLLDHLHDQQNQAPADRRGLAKELAELQSRLKQDPALENDPRFRTEVAWLLKDWPQHGGAGQRPWMPPAMAAEFNTLAATAPGLQNEELRGFLTQADGLRDRDLVRSVRQEALRVGALSPEEQMSYAVGRVIGALEDRITTALRAPEPAPVAVPQPVPESIQNVAPEPMPSEPLPSQTADPILVVESVAEPVEPAPQASPSPEPEVAAPNVAVDHPGAEPEATIRDATEERPEPVSPIQDEPGRTQEVGPSEATRQDVPVSDRVSTAEGRDAAAAVAGEDLRAADARVHREEQQVARAAEGAAPAAQHPQKSPRPGSSEEVSRQDDAVSQQTPTSKPTSTQDNTPAAGAPTGRASSPSQIPGMMTGAASSLAGWAADKAKKRGESRVHQLAQTVAEHVRAAEADMKTIQIEGGTFFAELEKTAQRDGKSREELIAGMTTGGPQLALRALFDQAMQNNPKLKAAHESAVENIGKVQRAYTNFNVEATARKLTEGPDVSAVYDGIEGMGKKAASIPGKEPGKNLLQEAGAMIEKLVERISGFLEQLRHRDREQQQSPSRGM